MYKLAAVIWIILGIALAGTAGMVVLSVPALEREAVELLPWVALGGFVLAIPASLFVASRILATTAGRA